MSTARLRTVSVDLPDALVRRVASHVGSQASFGTIVEHALELWLSRQETGGETRHRPLGETAGSSAGPSTREAV